MSRSNVASIALVAAAVTGAVMWYFKNAQARHHAHEGEVTRWEGEGGNVPDVAVENGNQGGGHGKPAVAASGSADSKAKTSNGASATPAGVTDVETEEPWPFPRS